VLSVREKENAFASGLNLQGMLTNIANVAGAIGNLAFAYQQIQSIGDIWSDDDLTSSEKIVQTITSLGMAIPMVVQALVSLKGAFTFLMVELLMVLWQSLLRLLLLPVRKLLPQEQRSL